MFEVIGVASISLLVAALLLKSYQIHRRREDEVDLFACLVSETYSSLTGRRIPWPVARELGMFKVYGKNPSLSAYGYMVEIGSYAW